MSESSLFLPIMTCFWFDRLSVRIKSSFALTGSGNAFYCRFQIFSFCSELISLLSHFFTLVAWSFCFLLFYLVWISWLCCWCGIYLISKAFAYWGEKVLAIIFCIRLCVLIFFKWVTPFLLISHTRFGCLEEILWLFFSPSSRSSHSLNRNSFRNVFFFSFFSFLSFSGLFDSCCFSVSKVSIYISWD